LLILFQVKKKISEKNWTNSLSLRIGKKWEIFIGMKMKKKLGR
jgi:hypothetical protein